MARSLDADFLESFFQLVPPGRTLWMVEFWISTTERVYLTDSDASITSLDINGDSVSFIAFPLVVSIPDEDATGAFSEAQIAIDNISAVAIDAGRLSAAIDMRDGLVGKKVILHRQFWANTSPDSAARYTTSLVVKSAVVSDGQVTLNLALPSIDNIVMPKAWYYRDKCRNVFRDAACGYGTPVVQIAHADNTSPIVIYTIEPHGLVDGDPVNIVGVGGTSNANSAAFFAFDRTVQNATEYTFETAGVNGNAPYTSGGQVRPDRRQRKDVANIIADPGITNFYEVETDGNHTIFTGQSVLMAGTGIVALDNQQFRAVRVNATKFLLDGTNATTTSTDGQVIFEKLTCDRTQFGANGCLAHDNTDRFTAMPGTPKAS